MVKFVLDTKKKIGNIIEIKERTFEIPNQRVCPEDGFLMDFSAHHFGYICTRCQFYLSARQYINDTLKENGEPTIEEENS